MRQNILTYILSGLIMGLLYNIFLYHSLGLLGIVTSLFIFCALGLLYGFISKGVDLITTKHSRTFKRLIRPVAKSGVVFIACWFTMREFFSFANHSDKFLRVLAFRGIEYVSLQIWSFYLLLF